MTDGPEHLDAAENDGFETRAIHAGVPPDAASGAVVAPITMSTTFAQTSVGEHAGWEYGRSGNPNRDALEATLASLETARFGFCFASGLAAEDAILRQLERGDRVILGADAYGGTFRLLDKVHRREGREWTAIDLTEPGTLEAQWPDGAKLVWVETPTNPALGVVDIAAVAAVAHRNGAMLVVDNTFATPYLQQPLSLGADLVVHSATKYLGGHSDVVGGFVATSNESWAERLRFTQNATGAVPSPFDCYLVQRGVKTLAVRMDRHVSNAWAVVDALVAHAAVDRVLYPGLDDHPGHAVAVKQMRAPGGMVSFTMVGGEKAALEVAAGTRLFTLAESLGAVESLIEHPGRMTHASAAGSPLEVDSALVRLSVGIETADDLVTDIVGALDRAGRSADRRRSTRRTGPR